MKPTLPVLTALLLVPLAALALEPTSLKTEFLENPLGLDTAKPRFSWIVEDSAEGAKQTGYQVQASSSEQKLAKGEADLWDSGKITSDQSHLVGYAGKPLASRQQAWWRVKSWDQDGKETGWSKPATFEIGLLERRDWAAQWIAAPEEIPDRSETAKIWARHTAQPGPDHTRNVEFLLSHFPPVPLFRKEFKVDGEVRRARLYLAVRGYAVPSLNGRRVSDRRLDPAYREYDLNTHYVTLDVTGLVKAGANALGLELGGGWHGIGEDRAISQVEAHRKRSECFLARLDIETDRGQATVVSDDTWTTAPGPTVKSVFFAGEAYDANRAMPGWDTTGFDAAAWARAKIVPEATEKLIPMLIPPERLLGTLQPVKRYQVGNNAWVFDFGRIFPGVVRLKAKMPAGTTIIQRWEQNNGSATPAHFYETPVQAPAGPDRLIGKANGVVPPPLKTSACYVYTAQGGAEPEEWTPEFDYQSIRYVEVIGYPGEPPLDLLEGRIQHTDLARVGGFQTSDRTIQTVTDRLLDTLAYCTHGIVQDNNCAERQQGNTCIVAANHDAMAFTFDLPQSTRKALDGLRLNTVDGIPPEILHTRGRGSLKRDDMISFHAAAAFLPWKAWIFTGDPSILEAHYPLMKGFIDRFADEVENRMEKLRCWGDWCDVWMGDDPRRPPTPFLDNLPRGYEKTVAKIRANPEEPVDLGVFPINTSIALSSAARYYGALRETIRTAEILGKKEDAAALRDLATRVQAKFIQTYYQPEKKTFGSQTADADALQFGLVPEGEKAAVARSLRDDVMKTSGGHFTGGYYLDATPAMLAFHGYADEAAAGLQSVTYPSYGQVLVEWDHRAMPERLPASRQAAGIGGNRRIQADKCPPARWGYDTLAGIKPLPEGPGFRLFELSPCFPANIASASAWHQSPYGKIESAWKRQGDTVRWNVTVPWNSRAKVKLPGGEKITLNDRPQSKQEFELAAGKWEITLSSSRPTATGTPR